MNLAHFAFTAAPCFIAGVLFDLFVQSYLAVKHPKVFDDLIALLRDTSGDDTEPSSDSASPDLWHAWVRFTPHEMGIADDQRVFVKMPWWPESLCVTVGLVTEVFSNVELLLWSVTDKTFGPRGAVVL